MSVELILYHVAVLLVGIVIGTFVVAIFPLKSNAQSLARNIYLQAIALLFGVGLALYYTLGNIDTTYIVFNDYPEGTSSFLIQTNIFIDRVNIPIGEIQRYLSKIKHGELM